MKTIFAVLFILALSGLLVACDRIDLIPPTPQGDPLAPTQTVDPLVPTPKGDPLAPTLEIFNPLDPSPTPSGSDLPLTCQVTDLNVFIDRAAGHCFAYPKRFAIGNQPLLNASAVLGPEVGHGGDTIRASFAVALASYDPNQLLDKQVDDFLREFTTAAPQSLARVSLTVGGEAAVMVDMVPVQLSWRLVFVPHNGQLYRLMYWPVDVPEAKADLEELYQTTIGSFAFLSASNPVLLPTETPTPRTPAFAGFTASYGVINFVLPPGVGSGAAFRDDPRVDGSDASQWQKTPGNLVVLLGEYYLLKGKANQPAIYVFPAKAYAEMVPAAFESMHRLNNLFAVREGPISAEQLPAIPFYDAKQVFASNIQVISFQNGRGVRLITEYAQYPASANNMDLFYEFQGLSNDGEHYIVAILPITFPTLAETSDAGAPLPAGGIPYPYMADPNADMQAYYAAVTALLDGASPESFVPTLSQLDALIQSIALKQH